MSRLLLACTSFLALSALAPTAAASQAAPAPTATATTGIPGWSIASADLPADPAVRFGTLPNGMRYALMHHETPKGGGAIRFGFGVGVREEEEGEAGYAHFVEHMAFNGSTNIPEGKLLPMLERLGLAFGADTNATTAIDRTIYQLDLPKVDDATVDAGLMMMREVAGNITLADSAVVAERGIIQSESRVRNTVQRRHAIDYIRTTLPGNRIADRIGVTPDAIGKTGAPGLRAFYQGYYRPERATLVMVGDFDVDAMEKKVRARFADWQAVGTARSTYAPPVKAGTAPTMGEFVDPAIAEQISMQRVTDYTPPRNSVEASREELLKAIGTMAISRRLSILSRDPASPIINGSASGDDFARSADTFGIDLTAKEGRWKEAIALGEQEMRRAQLHGFTAGEIAEAKTRFAANLANAADQAAGRQASVLAQRLVDGSIENQLSMSPAQQLALYNALAPTLTSAAVAEVFRKKWQGGPNAIHLAAKKSVGGSAAIAAAYQASTKVSVAAPVEQATKAFAYDRFGPSGKVVSDSRIADLGIRTVRFANGTQLNIKKTDYEPGRIAVRLEVDGGVRLFPADRPGLPVLVGALSPMDGLKAHDIDELTRLTAGKQVAYGLSPGADALVAGGVTNAKDLPLQMKLFAAKLSASGYRPETQVKWAATAPNIAKTIANDATQRFGIAAPALVAGNDARSGLLDPQALTRRSLDEMKAVIEPQLQHGAISIAVVGDADEQAVIDAVAASLGSLPARKPLAGRTAGAPLRFTADRTPRTVTHGGTADQGVVGLYWPTTDDGDFRSTMTRELLAQIMQLRLLDEVREKLGATYTPFAESAASDTYAGFGYLAVGAPATPGSIDSVVTAMTAIAAELAKAPPSDDEILRARKPMLEAFERQLRQNGSWLGLVADAQSRPERLDRRRTRAQLLSSLTGADVQAAAKQWLSGAPLVIRALPAAR
jgi:zinc protease